VDLFVAAFGFGLVSMSVIAIAAGAVAIPRRRQGAFLVCEADLAVSPRGRSVGAFASGSRSAA